MPSFKMSEKVYDPNSADYRIVSTLGDCFNKIGVVHLAQHVPSGELVAVKKYNVDKMSDELKLIADEIVLTRQLRHPNILIYNLAFVDGHKIYIICPLMGYRSCRDLLNCNFNYGLPENAIGLILRDVIEAVIYIHKKGYIHRAIKASHVLVSSDGRACLTGLRYSCSVAKNGRWQPQIHSFPIHADKSLKWSSPELLEQNLQGYNEKSDIYSVGVLICELANGCEPYEHYANILMLTEKMRGASLHIHDCTTLDVDETNYYGDSGVSTMFRMQAERRFSEGLHQITALCLQQESNTRPAAAQLLMHPFFRLHRRTSASLPEFLKPAIPLSDRVAFNTEDVHIFDNMDNDSDMNLNTSEWLF